MSVLFKNNAHSTLASSITDSATSITLATGHGNARFPATSSPSYFYATLIDGSNNLEVVKCTNRSADVLTVVRAQESTSGRAYSTGDKIELRITAQGLTDLHTTWSGIASFTAGDILYASDTTTLAKLAKGAASHVLQMNSGATAPEWAAAGSVTYPTISSISPSTIPNTATAVTITGGSFVTVPQVEAINPSTGIWYLADSVSFTNITTIVATFTLAVDATYKLRVENPDGLSVLSSSALLTVSDAPTWSTTAGSLGEVAAGSTVSLDVDASSDSTVAFTETTSILTSNASTPASTMNLTLNSSTGAITGTAPSPTSETTYNFTLRATDGESQTTDRAFSIKVTVGMNNSGQFNG